jgi:putative transcriptional regulator
MSTRVNNKQGPVARVTTGICMLVFIILCSSSNFMHATERIAITPDYPLHGPGLAKGVLLIAGKELRDPNFERTVVLITEYDAKGTVGLVINRRTKIPVSEALPELQKMLPILDHLYIGGPVAMNSINLLIRSGVPLADTIQVTDNIYLIDTLEQFNKLSPDEIEPANLRLYSGFAGWAPGQLESELIRGDWHLWHSSTEIVFDSVPENVWHDLIRLVSAKWVQRQAQDRANLFSNMEICLN